MGQVIEKQTCEEEDDEEGKEEESSCRVSYIFKNS